MTICQGVLQTGFLCGVGVGLELDGPFQLFSSMALILVVEFQTQEWGRCGLFSAYSSNQERLLRRGGLRKSGPASMGMDL